MDTDNHSAVDPISEKIDEFNGLKRTLLKNRLAPAQSPAERNRKLMQKQARVDLVGAKDSIAIVGTLGSIAEQINLQSCPLDTSALRGALLTVLDSASDPDAVARFHRRDAEFQRSKRRSVEGVRAFVAVARPSAALVAAAKALRLRRDDLAGGFAGRANLDALVELGRDYHCTVRVAHRDEQVSIVVDGAVDDTALALLAMENGAAGAEPTVASATVAAGSEFPQAPSGTFEEGPANGPDAVEASPASAASRPMGGFNSVLRRRPGAPLPSPSGEAGQGAGDGD